MNDFYIKRAKVSFQDSGCVITPWEDRVAFWVNIYDNVRLTKEKVDGIDFIKFSGDRICYSVLERISKNREKFNFIEDCDVKVIQKRKYFFGPKETFYKISEDAVKKEREHTSFKLIGVPITIEET